MNFTSAEIASWIGSYMWPLFRIGAFVGAAPIVGSAVVPMRIRLGLALLVTLVVTPLLPAAPAVEPLGADALFITLQQLIIGVAMGFILRLMFNALELAGQMIGQLMGLGFAAMIDPNSGVQVPVLSQFYVVMTTLLFLAFNGHLIMIEMLVDSFRALPVSTHGFGPDAVHAVVEWGGQMFAGAVMVALPAVAALLLVNIAFGVMTRAAPQLNVFAVGFPVTLLLGLVVLVMSMPDLPSQLVRLSDAAFGLMGKLAGGGAIHGI